MTDFALPVVRELVPLSPWSVTPHLAKQRERQARQALVLRSEQELYCRFEKRHGNLECAFSALGRASADRPLLGETIRNWLAGGQEADFLWCESLAEGFALTLVMGGHVAKDGIYAPGHAIQELKLALSQLLRCGRAAKVYPGDPVAKQRVEAVLEELTRNDESEPMIVTVDAPHSLARHWVTVDLPPSLTRLDGIPDIKAWNRLWRLVRYTVSALVVGLMGFLAYYFIGQFGQEEIAPQTPVEAKRNYVKLLAGPPADDVLLAIHSAYRQFVGDDVFADFLAVRQVSWAGPRVGTMAARDAPGELVIRAHLVVVDDDWDDRKLANAFPQQLAGHAKEHGWEELTVRPVARVQKSERAARNEVSQGSAAEVTVTRRLPSLGKRSTEQALANRQAPPRSDDGRLLWTNGLQEMLSEAWTVRVVGSGSFDVYQTTEVALELSNTEWLDRDVVEWIARRLNNGPVVLDSVELSTTEGGGKEDKTTITFRLVWCVASGDARCVEPLTEDDFAPPPVPAVDS